jgi:predicted GNAT family acetyltransferase
MDAVTHDPEQQIFFVEHEEEHAYLSYQIISDSVLEYAHTYTPNEIRGKGIATRIIKFSLEYARSEGIQIVPSCPFVAAYIERHPDYSDLVYHE